MARLSSCLILLLVTLIACVLGAVHPRADTGVQAVVPDNAKIQDDLDRLVAEIDAILDKSPNGEITVDELVEIATPILQDLLTNNLPDASDRIAATVVSVLKHRGMDAGQATTIGEILANVLDIIARNWKGTAAGCWRKTQWRGWGKTAKCPSGYVVQGDECVEFNPKNYSDDDDDFWAPEFLAVNKSAPVPLTCENGMKAEGQRCYKQPCDETFFKPQGWFCEQRACPVYAPVSCGPLLCLATKTECSNLMQRLTQQAVQLIITELGNGGNPADWVKALLGAAKELAPFKTCPAPVKGRVY